METSTDRSSIILFVVRVALSAIGFLGTAYFARELGPEALGIYFTFEALLNLLGIPALFGVDVGLEKRLSETSSDERDQYMTAALGLSLLPLVSILVVSVFARDAINNYVGIGAVPLLIGGLVVGNLSRLLISALRGEQKIASSALMELIGELARVIVSVSLIIEGFGAISLLWGFVVGLAIRLIITFPLIDSGFAVPSRSNVDSLLHFSAYSVSSTVSGLLYNWADTLLLALILSKSAVGVYEAAWKISIMAIMAGQALGMSLFPMISKWHADGDMDRVKNAFTEGITYSTILVFPSIVGVLVLRNDLMYVVYGFKSGGIILVILVLGKVFQAVSGIAGRVLMGLDKPQLAFLVTLLLALVNVVLNVLLIPVFGMTGAAIATLSTSLLVCALSVYLVRQFIDAPIDIREQIWQVSSAVIMGGFVVVAGVFVPPDALISLSINVIVGIIAYSAMILVKENHRHRIARVIIR